MDGSLQRFVRLLRLFGLRVSVSEAADAMRAAALPGMLADRETLREALRLTLIKDRRDDEVFDEIFDAFFCLRRVAPRGEHDEPGHAHDDLADTGELKSLILSEELPDNPQQGHSHGRPADIREFFDAHDLAQQYNLHQEANKLDLAGMTDEIVLSEEGASGRLEGVPSVQVETGRGRLTHQVPHRAGDERGEERNGRDAGGGALPAK